MQYAPNPLPKREALPDYSFSYISDSHYPEFDKRDFDIMLVSLAQRALLRTERGPLVGDLVRMPDGSLRRFTHAWPIDTDEWTRDSRGTIQTTALFTDFCTLKPKPAAAEQDHSDHGGFYLCKDGGCSFSGSLDYGVPFNKIKPSNEPPRLARYWFFHHGYSGAHNGVSFTALTPVWEYAP